MQKHLDDLARQAGFAPEWKDLLRDLDRLAQVRIRHRSADWLVRTDAASDVTRLFKCAHVALPPRAHQARPRRRPRPNLPENAAAAPSVAHANLNFVRTPTQSAACKNQVFKSGLNHGRNRIQPLFKRTLSRCAAFSCR